MRRTWRGREPRIIDAGRIPALVFPALILFSSLVACLPHGWSGIEGLTVIGPSRPTVKLGEGQPKPTPFATTLLVLAAGDRHIVGRVKTESDGRFRIELPPGEYILTVLPASGQKPIRLQEQSVRVEPGKASSVTLRFDSGLR